MFLMLQQQKLTRVMSEDSIKYRYFVTDGHNRLTITTLLYIDPRNRTQESHVFNGRHVVSRKDRSKFFFFAKALLYRSFLGL
jgi:hypothetical protein